MGGLQPTHWIIVAVVLVILFGSKKLPDAARGLGRSLRIFKSEVKEMQNDGPPAAAAPAAPAVTPQLPAVTPVTAEAAPVTPQTEPRTS